MGGAAAGEVASSLAVDEMMRLLTSRGSAHPLAQRCGRGRCAANQAILMRAQSSPSSTAWAPRWWRCLWKTTRWMVNVGDSRGYRLRNSHLEQITLDHSLVEEQVRMGRMDRLKRCARPSRT